MNIVLLGVQGSGKGTILYGLQKHLNFTLISTGQLLRDEVATGSELGKHIDYLLVNGMLVETETVVKIISNKLAEHNNEIVIFDGFPRTIEQLNIFEQKNKFDLVIHLDLPVEMAKERLLNRLMCDTCGQITSKKATGLDVCRCGGKLIRRTDDTEAGINKRLELYEKETKPLLQKFREYGIVVDINVNRYPTEIVEDVLKVIKNECNN